MQKVNTTETIKIAGGYLNTGLSPANRYSGPARKTKLSQKRTKVKTLIQNKTLET